MESITEAIDLLNRLSERITMAREMINAGLVKQREVNDSCPSSKGFCVIGEFLIADTMQHPEAIEIWQTIVAKRPEA